MQHWKDISIAEKTVLLTAFALEGLTSGEMARKFEGATRNSIVGHCHRHGISLAGSTGGRPRLTEEEKAERAAKRKAKMAARAVVEPDPMEALFVVPVEPVVSGNPKNILQIGNFECRRPLFEDPKQDVSELLFCAAAVAGGTAYCGPCCRIMFDGVRSQSWDKKIKKYREARQ